VKIKIVGWLYIMASPIFLLGGGLSLLTMGDTFANPAMSLLIGLGGILLGIYSLFLGSAVKAHKTWSYKAGLITFSLVGAGNLIQALMGNLVLLLAVLFNVFCVYALISEKQLFNKTEEINTSPTPNVPLQTSQNDITTHGM
jgi:hypothetical protein